MNNSIFSKLYHIRKPVREIGIGLTTLGTTLCYQVIFFILGISLNDIQNSERNASIIYFLLALTGFCQLFAGYMGDKFSRGNPKLRARVFLGITFIGLLMFTISALFLVSLIMYIEMYQYYMVIPLLFITISLNFIQIGSAVFLCIVINDCTDEYKYGITTWGYKQLLSSVGVLFSAAYFYLVSDREDESTQILLIIMTIVVVEFTVILWLVLAFLELRNIKPYSSETNDCLSFNIIPVFPILFVVFFTVCAITPANYNILALFNYWTSNAEMYSSIVTGIQNIVFIIIALICIIAKNFNVKLMMLILLVISTTQVLYIFPSTITVFLFNFVMMSLIGLLDLVAYYFPFVYISYSFFPKPTHLASSLRRSLNATNDDDNFTFIDLHNSDEVTMLNKRTNNRDTTPNIHSDNDQMTTYRYYYFSGTILGLLNTSVIMAQMTMSFMRFCILFIQSETDFNVPLNFIFASSGIFALIAAIICAFFLKSWKRPVDENDNVQFVPVSNFN